ncbi:Translation initiation factor 3 subunit c [Coemansia sp. Benny D115]|nr:Translation initiation factor 3 subunit c [Coemansia sp. Benny D115]
MSRFFRGNESSSSDSESSDSSASDFSGDEAPLRQAAQGKTGRLARLAYDDSDSEEEVKRVVKSPKQKQTDEVVALSKSILASARESKWNDANNEFNKLQASAEKLQKILGKDGKMPHSFLKCMVYLEDIMENNARFKAEQAKSNALDARNMNPLRQRLRKFKAFKAQVAEERANPSVSEDEAEEEEEEAPASRSTGASNAVSEASESESESESDSDSGSEEDSEDSESDWDSSSEEESESEDEDAPKVGFSRWLKKAPTKQSAAKQEAAKKVKKDRVQRPAQTAAAAGDDDSDDGFTTVGKGGKAEQGPVYSSETLNKHLQAVLESRGRKGTDKKAAIRSLEKLLSVAANPLQKVKVLLALVSAQFDSIPVSSHMSTELWTDSQARVNDLLAVLEANLQIVVSETGETHNSDQDIKYANEPITVSGSIVGLIDRLDDEFTKSLQNIDPHTPEYVERMRDAVPLYRTIVRSQFYFERADLKESLCRIVLRRLEHLYYRTDAVNLRVNEATADLKGSDATAIVPASAAGDMEATIHHLCTFLYLHADPLLRTRAMLMHIFNHALHKRYYVARDLLLMSHIQESVHQADVNTQVLYNRALAQLGLAAFRLGKIQESFEHIVELEASGRQRELLAQGVGQQRTQQLSQNEEQLQRQRQLPFHININLELLECVFLTSSMLLEIPAMASANSNPEARRAPISRIFRRMLDFNERQVFLGPPENTRDHIMAASKALASGDWEAARDYIQSITIWSLLPDCEDIKTMLASKIQLEALRTYLFTYSSQFESIGLEDLSVMFGMSRPKVYSLLARMVYRNELQASLDEVSGVLVFNMANFEASSRLQQTALVLSNKANAFADINERMFELKINGGQTPGDRQQGGNEHGNRQQGDRDGRQNNQQRGGNRDGQRGSGHQGQGRMEGGKGGGRGGARNGQRTTRGGRGGGNRNNRR